MMVWPGWGATNTSGRESTRGPCALKQKYHLPSKCAVFCAFFFKKKIVFLLSKKFFFFKNLFLLSFTSNLLSFTTFYSVLPRLVLSFTKYPSNRPTTAFTSPATALQPLWDCPDGPPPLQAKPWGAGGGGSKIPRSLRWSPNEGPMMGPLGGASEQPLPCPPGPPPPPPPPDSVDPGPPHPAPYPPPNRDRAS